MDNAERSEFDKTPRGRSDFWKQEMDASDTMLKKFTKDGNSIVKRFLGKTGTTTDNFLLNFFHVNIVTLESMLYSNRPKVDVSRTYSDPDDDVARIASEILERMLNLDVEDNGEDYDSLLKGCLSDRLMPGLGVAKVRYDADWDKEDGEDVLEWEDAILEYFHWRDVRWGWGRTWSEVPWVAFCSYMSKDEATERFSEKVAEGLTYKKHNIEGDEAENTDPDMDDPTEKAQVWEIWDKEEETVVWWSPGSSKLLDAEEDPLGLRSFYPCPPFFAANVTTDVYVPKADFALAQDLYNEIDNLQTRISILTDAVKVVGVYDKNTPEVGRIFNEGVDNDLIPVENWAMFGEKGGMKGVVDWVPLDQVVKAIAELQGIRTDTIQLLYQVTGMSDIMRGSVDHAREGVGQSQLKAKFGSIRVQQLQEEFAKFAGELMSLKAEVIVKHFDAATIAERSNLKYMPDAVVNPDLYAQAIALLKNPDALRLRVSVRPESVAMIDYAELKDERTGYMTALGTFMQSSAGLLQLQPAMMPYLLQLLQWGLAGYKGGQQIEGVMDKAIKDAQNAAKQPQEEQPDPAQVAAEAKMAEMQAKHQSDMEQIQAKHQSDMAKLEAETQARVQEAQAKSQSDIEEELQTSAINAEQHRENIQLEMERDERNHLQKLEQQEQAHRQKMEQISAQNAVKREASTSE